MSKQTATYHFLSCNGKLSNLIQPNCQTVSEGGFDQTVVELEAMGSGWSQDGNKDYCPACSARRTPAASAVQPPSRRPRKAAAADPAPEYAAEHQQ